MGKAKKKVSTPRINTKNVPRPHLPGAGTSDERLCWRFCHVDHDSRWSFGKVDGTNLRWLMERLSQLESMTTGEVFTGGYPGKEYDIEAIPTAAAVDRLDELGLGDMTRIGCLRLQGEPRLYGFLHTNVFHVVWWDPGHEIWPSHKKHT